MGLVAFTYVRTVRILEFMQIFRVQIGTIERKHEQIGLIMNIEKGVPKIFSVSETAQILGCSRSQIYVLISDGELESVKIRGSRRVTENQILRYIRRIEA
jgi:excisionase family DNA binding protein